MLLRNCHTIILQKKYWAKCDKNDRVHQLVWKDAMAVLNVIREQPPLSDKATTTEKANFIQKYEDKIDRAFDEKWPRVSNHAVAAQLPRIHIFSFISTGQLQVHRTGRLVKTLRKSHAKATPLPWRRRKKKNLS